jgi:DNA-binding NarL/FixJ family response regulator
MALRLHPSVVVMDIAMPLLNGVHATRLIREKDPHVKVIVLSMYAAEEFVTQSIASGASGYLVKQYAAAELLLAIREVVKGHAYFSPSVSRLLVEKLGRAIRGEEAVQPMSPLTYREIEVLQLISEGLSNKDISVELDISVKTVEKHRGHIMSRLNIHDVAGLTRYAISRGIIGADLETGKISS